MGGMFMREVPPCTITTLKKNKNEREKHPQKHSVVRFIVQYPYHHQYQVRFHYQPTSPNLLIVLWTNDNFV